MPQSAEASAGTMPCVSFRRHLFAKLVTPGMMTNDDIYRLDGDVYIPIPRRQTLDPSRTRHLPRSARFVGFQVGVDDAQHRAGRRVAAAAEQIADDVVGLDGAAAFDVA
jgi:hypothetical protein